jgi:hypothetical protein
MADVDEVARDHPKANPSLHTCKASVPAAIQSVTTLQYADATCASGPPALPGSERGFPIASVPSTAGADCQ